MKYEIGTEVATPKGNGTVVELVKGWYTVDLETGPTKFREKQLSAVVEQTMSSQLNKYRTRYQATISGSGSKSLSNGDDLAIYLQLKTPQEVCRIADEACGTDAGFHETKYAKLNQGQQRMNAGNKIRARIKNGEWSIPQQ